MNSVETNSVGMGSPTKTSASVGSGARRLNLGVLAASMRQWSLVVRDELPLQFWILGSMVPLVFRSVVYVFVGRMAAGDAGARWASLGVVAIAITGETVSHVSDVPIYDVWFATWGAVTRAPAPVVLQYAARSVTHVLPSLVAGAPLSGAHSEACP